MPDPLLIDVGPLSCGCTDHALEALAKAQSISDDSLWTPHHDPFIRDHLEDVTDRGVQALTAILDSLLLFIGGGQLAKAKTIERWTPEQLSAVRRRLERRGPDAMGLDDWLLLVDWLIQRYLPADVALSEAEYLAVRSAAAGKIQAATEHRGLTEQQKALLAGHAPTAMSQWETAFGKPAGLEAAVLDFARARAAQLITDIGERTRHRMKSLIIAHQENLAIGSPDATAGRLQQQLFDEFAFLNRDWRRIAITETARDANEGFVSALRPGAKVRRVEAYDACPFCKKIDGMTFTVVSPTKEHKNGWTEIWVGKTNVGRSAAPRKRVGDELVERTDEEMWWPAAGTMHPNCRGTWVRVSVDPPGVNPKFKKWLDKELANA